MKQQGRADRSNNDGYKPRTNPHAINVKGVSQIGSAIGNHVTGKSKILQDVARPIHAGRGFSSPLGSPGTPGVGAGRTIHKSGSQGRSE